MTFDMNEVELIPDTPVNRFLDALTPREIALADKKSGLRLSHRPKRIGEPRTPPDVVLRVRAACMGMYFAMVPLFVTIVSSLIAARLGDLMVETGRYWLIVPALLAVPIVWALVFLSAMPAVHWFAAAYKGRVVPIEGATC